MSSHKNKIRPSPPYIRHQYDQIIADLRPTLIRCMCRLFVDFGPIKSRYKWEQEWGEKSPLSGRSLYDLIFGGIPSRSQANVGPMHACCWGI